MKERQGKEELQPQTSTWSPRSLCLVDVAEEVEDVVVGKVEGGLKLE